MIALIVFAACLVYFAPTFTVLIRNGPGTGPVIVVNVFLGWTVIGWVVALAMACRGKADVSR